MTLPRKHYSPTFKSQVVQEVLEGNKTLSQIASEHAIHPNVITKWKRAALEALPATFDEGTDKQIKALIERYEKEKEELYAQIGRLTTELRWLEKKVKLGLPRPNRVALIERERDHPEVEGEVQLPLCRQAELLGISRSSLYYRPVAPSKREIALKHRIDEIYTECLFFTSEKGVFRILREANSSPILSDPEELFPELHPV